MTDWYTADTHWILTPDWQLKSADLMTWARAFEDSNNRTIKQQTVLPGTVHQYRVSTVFLGIDHNFGDGQPLLFETMVFGSKYDGYMERCCTAEEAVNMHKRVMRMVKDGKEDVNG